MMIHDTSTETVKRAFQTDNPIRLEKDMKTDHHHRPLWVVSEFYCAEGASDGYFLTKIAEGLASSRPVHVICGQPSYSSRKIRTRWSEIHHGVAIRRCWATTWNKDIWPFRLINWLTISISIFIRLLCVLRRGDQVLVVTSPPLLPYVADWACRLRGADCFLLVHDMYPEVFVGAGLLASDSWIVKLLEHCSRQLHRSVKGIVVLGRDMLELVQAKLRPAERQKTLIITNWADIDAFYPTPRKENSLLKTLGLSDKFVVLYAGNMGPLHNLEAVLDSAEQLRQDSGIHFLLVGSGAKRAWLERSLLQRGLENVTLLPPRSWNGEREFLEILNACDVSMITFAGGMAGVSVPSRMYNVLATGKPIVALAEPDSEIARVVEEENVGWVAHPDDPKGFAQAIVHARSQIERLGQMGARARQVAERKYQFKHILPAYERLLDGSADSPADRHVPNVHRFSRRPRRINLLHFQRFLKRAIDLLVAAAALTVGAPLFGCIALLIRWKMGSPILFRQRRPGHHARPFTLWKFRTMNDAYDGNGQWLPDGDRLTTLGRFLRRTSLDELPQFWNVLRGDMSLVGPRPLLMEYLPRYTAEQARRHQDKPGITGWAQVNGRNAITWEEKFALDVWYIDHWSLGLDLRILLVTAQKVLHGKGISAANHFTMPEFTRSNPVQEVAA